jgi:hypothetical protein
MRNLLVAAIGALTAAVGSASAMAEAPTTVSFKFRIGVPAFVPCALGGAGEEVETSGTAHMVIHLAHDGITYGVTHANYQGLSGTGLTSGDKYRAVSAETDVTPTAKFNVVTITEVIQFIGQGPNNNFRIYFLFHFTVNANGEGTASLNRFRVECQ